MQNDVAVLGLGHMGSVLARCFLERGLATTVWNRTSEKAAPLVAVGAQAAPDPGGALAGSRLAVVCLERYESVERVLAQAAVTGTLSGCSIVNLTWGTPEEARAMSRWVHDQGASYLDGNIYDYPANVGPDSHALSYAGDRAVFDEHADTLSALSTPVYDGDDPAIPNILGSAGSVYHHVAIAGFYEAAAYAAHFGVSKSAFLEFSERTIAPLTSHACEMAVHHLAASDFASDQAALSTHLDAIHLNRADMHAIGQPATMLGAFADVLDRVAVQKGHLALAAAYEDLSATRR